MAHDASSTTVGDDAPVVLFNERGPSPVVLACEHASNFVPSRYGSLGLDQQVLNSHVAWDPGAMAVSMQMSKMLGARLVAGGVSRLIYDCNRPPSAPDAIPAKSELFEIPGNQGLSAQDRAERAQLISEPFHRALDRAITAVQGAPIIVTIHSFTPIYYGKPRDVEIGVLHDSDARLADAMMVAAPGQIDLNVQRNQPYGMADGVTHTLKQHGLKNGHLNVMLEFRNDILTTPEQQSQIAGTTARWLVQSLAALGVEIQLEGQAE